MSTTEAGADGRLEALHARMAESSLAGHWQPRRQRPELVPRLPVAGDPGMPRRGR